MGIKNSALITALLCLLLMSATGVVAGNDDLAGGGERYLGGHGFLPSQYIEDPFIGTYFMNQVGGAKAVNLTTPFYNLDGELIYELKGDVVYASLGMAFQKMLGSNWAVGVNGAGLIRSGVSAQALVANGADADMKISAWVKRRIMRREKSQLTGGLNWDRSSTTAVDIWGFSQHIHDGGSLDSAPLVLTDSTWNLQVTAQYAYAFNPTFGLRMDGKFGVREKRNGGDTLMGNNRIGLLGEVDFKEQYHVPVGVTLGYFQGFPMDRLGSGLSGTVLGFWYTGREDFVLGVESGWLSFPVSDNGDSVDGIFGVLNAKFYF